MKDARLNGLALINIHKQISLTYNEILMLWVASETTTIAFSRTCEPDL
jgi:hypothetical protein